jgi:hypothetical protein
MARPPRHASAAPLARPHEPALLFGQFPLAAIVEVQ